MGQARLWPIRAARSPKTAARRQNGRDVQMAVAGSKTKDRGLIERFQTCVKRFSAAGLDETNAQRPKFRFVFQSSGDSDAFLRCGCLAGADFAGAALRDGERTAPGATASAGAAAARETTQVATAP